MPAAMDLGTGNVDRSGSATRRRVALSLKRRHRSDRAARRAQPMMQKCADPETLGGFSDRGRISGDFECDVIPEARG